MIQTATRKNILRTLENKNGGLMKTQDLISDLSIAG